MEMPEISQCAAGECAYNSDSICHALAITIGDPKSTPLCDTFISATSQKGGDPESHGHVGACKASACKWNDHLECSAPSIEVDHKGSEVDCMTFETQ